VVEIAAAAAALAGAVHVYIFVLESLLWTTPRARAIFGTTETDARTTRSMAVNQGFYNLFLAVAALLGAVLLLTGTTTVGATLVYTGAGSMVLAGLVLIATSRDKLRPALVQAVPPAVAVVALTLHLV